MKSILKLCRITFKRNRLFSIGLLFVFLLATAISFFGTNFVPSAKKSLDEYFINYGMADAWFVSNPLPNGVKDEIQNVDGVMHVDERFVINMNASTIDNSIYSFRVFSYNENSLLRQKITSSLNNEKDGAIISDKFAEDNCLKLGDELSFNTPFGIKHITITAFAYNPETSATGYNDLSFYEDGQFGYLYIHRGKFDDMFYTQGLSNNWTIYFDDDVDNKQREYTMSEIRKIFDENLLSESVKDSYIQLDQDLLESFRKLCNFVPIIAFAIAVGFSMLLLWQCIDNQKKTVGLLRALGYSVKQTMLIYVLFIMIITTIAIIGGIGLGLPILQLCLRQYALTRRIGEICIVIRYPIVFFFCFIAILCALFICLLSAKKVSSIEPSLAYSDSIQSEAKPPRLLKKLKINAFFKVSLASIFRNKKRLILSSLCTAICVFCMTMILEIRASCVLPINEVFDGRYCYSLLVHGADENLIDNIKHVEDVEKVESIMTFSAEMKNGDFSEFVTIQGIESNSSLIILKNSSGDRIVLDNGIVIEEMFAKENNISVGDTVTISNKELQVSSIARELMNPVMYVSVDIAKTLTSNDANDIILNIASNADINEVTKQIHNLKDNLVIIQQAKQKATLTHAFDATQLVLYVFLILVFGIGTFIVFNMSVINFNEKVLDFATMRALGTPTIYYSLIFVIENAIQILFGILMICPFSYFMIDILLKSLSSLTQQFPMIDFAKYLFISILISFSYILVGLFASIYKVKKMDFIQCLNQTE